MSTTFNIIPTKVDNSLTFKNVLTLAKQTLVNQLDRLSINLPIDFLVNIHHDKEEYVNSINPDTKFIWTENEYAWFRVGKSNGGTDAYCQKISEHLSDWDTYIEDTLDNIVMTPPCLGSCLTKQQSLETLQKNSNQHKPSLGS
jgi:hypothetical protein